jgi:hypothetical protein
MMPVGVLQVDASTKHIQYTNVEVKRIVGDIEGLMEKLS